MEKEIWDARYSAKEYIYGVEPNNFLKSYIDNNPPCSILFPAEGEGRNAVYAASKGWEVAAFDISEAAKNKALKLAKSKNVEINYFISDLIDFKHDDKFFDTVAIVYMHVKENIRNKVFDNIFSALRKGGNLVFEAFEKKQINYKSGGPKDQNMLYSKDEVMYLLKSFSEIKVWEEIINLNEGSLHKGEGVVVRALAKK